MMSKEIKVRLGHESRLLHLLILERNDAPPLYLTTRDRCLLTFRRSSFTPHIDSPTHLGSTQDASFCLSEEAIGVSEKKSDLEREKAR